MILMSDPITFFCSTLTKQNTRISESLLWPWITGIPNNSLCTNPPHNAYVFHRTCLQILNMAMSEARYGV
jgi:hypothetical protein